MFFLEFFGSGFEDLWLQPRSSARHSTYSKKGDQERDPELRKDQGQMLSR